MSKIKHRKLYFLFMLLEILLLIMISGWYYFSERKMGMIRHILYRNIYKFPKYFTDTNIKVIIACFIVILVFIIFSIYFIINYNADKVFIYYYLIMFCGLFNTFRFLQYMTLNHKKEK